jgi:hypothetical protein
MVLTNRAHTNEVTGEVGATNNEETATLIGGKGHVCLLEGGLFDHQGKYVHRAMAGIGGRASDGVLWSGFNNAACLVRHF